MKNLIINQPFNHSQNVKYLSSVCLQHISCVLTTHSVMGTEVVVRGSARNTKPPESQQDSTASHALVAQTTFQRINLIFSVRGGLPPLGGESP